MAWLAIAPLGIMPGPPLPMASIVPTSVQIGQLPDPGTTSGSLQMPCSCSHAAFAVLRLFAHSLKATRVYQPMLGLPAAIAGVRKVIVLAALEFRPLMT